MRSEPSGVGWGRDVVGGRARGGVAGSSKWNSGSGNREIVSEMRIEVVETMYMW